MKIDYHLLYVLGLIAAGSWAAVYMFTNWKGVILGLLVIFGVMAMKDTIFPFPWFLYPLEYPVKAAAIIFMLLVIDISYHINEIMTKLKEDSTNAQVQEEDH